jgi:hypothetical protein
MSKIKSTSNGSRDMLKVRIVVQGDISNLEDKWSPISSFRGLKIVHSSSLKFRVCQSVFVRAYSASNLTLQMHFMNSVRVLEDQYDI